MPLEVKLVVKGLVQGVGYRAHCRMVAQQAGVTGYADNLPDGSVEVYACGEEEKVKQFVELLKRTKPHDAAVEEIEELHRNKCDFVPESFRII